MECKKWLLLNYLYINAHVHIFSPNSLFQLIYTSDYELEGIVVI